jgi:cytochrome oxidase Cu insertion factor (SCO1/SenC/PrrC family)
VSQPLDRPRSGARAPRVLAALLAAALTACGGDGPAASSGGSSLAVEADSDFRGPALPAFELTERSGREVTLADLAGRTWVLDFVFSTCTGPCPRMSAGMEVLQGELADTGVRLVSVSVDPERDTPEVLSAYADLYSADPERWWFLTGEREQVGALAQAVHLALAPDPDAPLGRQVTHSTRLLVIDGEGVVRGYYDGLSEEGRLGAAARARHLDRPR